MRILLVTREFPPTIVGGIARLSYYLYKYLKVVGADVNVVAFGDDSDSPNDVLLFKPSSSIAEKTGGSLSGDFRILTDVISFTRFVNKLINEEKIDVVHVLEPYVGGFVKHKHKITTMHDTTIKEIKAWIKYPFNYSFKRLAFYLSLGYTMDIASIYRSKVLIAPSIGTVRILKTAYRVPIEKIRIIPNGIEPPSVNLDQQVAKKMLGLAQDEVLIFSTAHHVARKRLETLIEAVKYLQVIGIQGFRVIVGGEGPLTSYYRALTHKHGLDKLINFVGWIDENKLSVYYSACDIFVITSESEAGPISLLEAAIRGKAIVTTNIDGLSAFMQHYVHCLKFNVGDSKTLAKCLKMLIDEDELRLSLAINAKKFANLFTWDKIANKVIRVYKEVLHQHGK
ncbi:MAG: glycosyltransferase family 4 protein [Nitrososphaeria archaeon]